MTTPEPRLCIGHHRGPRPTVTRYLCRHCIDDLERDLAETPALAELVARDFLAAGQGGAGSDESRKTKGSPPLPLRVEALDALRDLQDVLISWTLMVAEDQQVTPPSGIPHCSTLARFLLRHAAWIVEQPWVDDLQGELAASVRPLRVITGEVVPQVTLSKACPYCGEQSLRVRPDASSDVVCRTQGCQDEGGEIPRWTRATWHLLLTDTTEDVA